MIVVIGDLLVDVFVLPELSTPEQPGGMALRSGGSAANTAAWLAWSGHPSSFVGCVGDDSSGRLLMDDLRRQGVAPRVRIVPGVESGAVLVNLTPEGERVMRSSRGANVDLDPDDVRAADTDDIRAVHLTGYALLSRAGMQLLQAAADLARSRSVPLSFDPASPSTIASIGRVALRRALKQFAVSILLPNIDEGRALSAYSEPLDIARDLGEVVPTVLLKMGHNGALAAEAGGTSTVVPSVRQRPVDTTGAGDAFDAGALGALTEGRHPADACLAGHALAGRVIAAIGGRPPPGDRSDEVVG